MLVAEFYDTHTFELYTLAQLGDAKYFRRVGLNLKLKDMVCLSSNRKTPV